MSKRLTTEEFVERVRKAHGDKYDYSLVNYVNNCTKVTIICPKHGEFEQEPRMHLSHGCPQCGQEKGAELWTSTTEEFIQKAMKIHGSKYDYSKTDYVKSHEKVCIICPKHGEFWQKPAAHLIGNGCPRCGHERRIEVITKTQGDFIERAKQVHGDKYDYSEVQYVHCQEKVHILCPKHGSFWQRPNTHLEGSGCPQCGTESSFQTAIEKGTIGKSQVEDELACLLEKQFGTDNVKRQYQDERYPFPCDFYIKTLDLFIELNAFWTHGGHWFDENSQEDIERLKILENKSSEFYAGAIHTWTVRDPLKRKTAEENNLKYLVFWDNDLADAKAWLETQ